MMNKLRKMLLISFSLVAVSCGKIPPPPEILEATPIWHEPEDGVVEVKYFYGRNSTTGEKFTWSNAEARSRGMICTDTDSTARAEMYKRQLEKLAKERCR